MRFTAMALSWFPALGLDAQERLLSPSDLLARQTATAVVAFGLDAIREFGAVEGLPRLQASLATAKECLPAGLAAKARLAELSLQEDAAALLPSVLDLFEDMTFQPVVEAELPAGVPGFTALGELELRHYPAYRMVRTPMRGGAIGAFWPLFQHIQAKQIAMTTPVQIDYQTDGERTREASMAFLYGSSNLGAPGADGKVEVVDVAPMTVVTIGSRGYDRPSRVAELRTCLDAWLARNPAYEAAGELRTMGYNSPSVASDRRYFEVQLPVRCVVRAPARGSI